jgi:hypothetical protein
MLPDVTLPARWGLVAARRLALHVIAHVLVGEAVPTFLAAGPPAVRNVDTDDLVDLLADSLGLVLSLLSPVSR